MNGEKVSNAKLQIRRDNEQKDLISAGFKALAPKLMHSIPGGIKWGELYKKFNTDEKIEYLEKLAHTMNNAAAVLQKERDELNKLCGLKEGQIQTLSRAIGQNNSMLQSEVAKMNEERQAVNAESARLRQKIKELESQIN